MHLFDRKRSKQTFIYIKPTGRKIESLCENGVRPRRMRETEVRAHRFPLRGVIVLTGVIVLGYGHYDGPIGADCCYAGCPLVLLASLTRGS